MFLALVNNQRVEATPKAEGICPHCKSLVNAKCGRVYVKHWAHKNLEECDIWYEPETKWHYNWKKLFGLEYAERRISKDGTWHVADILTKDEIVIEFEFTLRKYIPLMKFETSIAKLVVDPMISLLNTISPKLL